MQESNYEIVERLCEATTQLLEIIRKQEEIIAQYEVSEEVRVELADMKNNVDRKMDSLEFRLRSYRRECGEW